MVRRPKNFVLFVLFLFLQFLCLLRRQEPTFVFVFQAAWIETGYDGKLRGKIYPKLEGTIGFRYRFPRSSFFYFDFKVRIT